LSVDQIDRLVKVALKPSEEFKSSEDFRTRINAVEAIAAYGDAAIPALIQVSEESTEAYVREHALEMITRIKKGG
jgi:HEAT repeat protein